MSPCSHNQVSGTGINAHLTFDPPELTLPIVPLGQAAAGEVTVTNHGYDHLDLRGRLSVDASSLPLKVEFPNGSVVTKDTPKITFSVTFSSPVPLAFTTRVTFGDPDGNAFGLRVVGTADNSLLTLYAHMGAERGGLGFHVSRATGAVVAEPATLEDKQREHVVASMVPGGDRTPRSRSSREILGLSQSQVGLLGSELEVGACGGWQLCILLHACGCVEGGVR